MLQEEWVVSCLLVGQLFYAATPLFLCHSRSDELIHFLIRQVTFNDPVLLVEAQTLDTGLETLNPPCNSYAETGGIAYLDAGIAFKSIHKLLF